MSEKGTKISSLDEGTTLKLKKILEDELEKSVTVVVDKATQKEKESVTMIHKLEKVVLDLVNFVMEGDDLESPLSDIFKRMFEKMITDQKNNPAYIGHDDFVKCLQFTNHVIFTTWLKSWIYQKIDDQKILEILFDRKVDVYSVNKTNINNSKNTPIQDDIIEIIRLKDSSITNDDLRFFVYRALNGFSFVETGNEYNIIVVPLFVYGVFYYDVKKVSSNDNGVYTNIENVKRADQDTIQDIIDKLNSMEITSGDTKPYWSPLISSFNSANYNFIFRTYQNMYKPNFSQITLLPRIIDIYFGDVIRLGVSPKQIMTFAVTEHFISTMGRIKPVSVFYSSNNKLVDPKLHNWETLYNNGIPKDQKNIKLSIDEYMIDTKLSALIITSTKAIAYNIQETTPNIVSYLKIFGLDDHIERADITYPEGFFSDYLTKLRFSRGKTEGEKEKPSTTQPSEVPVLTPPKIPSTAETISDKNEGSVPTEGKNDDKNDDVGGDDSDLDEESNDNSRSVDIDDDNVGIPKEEEPKNGNEEEEETFQPSKKIKNKGELEEEHPEIREEEYDSNDEGEEIESIQPSKKVKNQSKREDESLDIEKGDDESDEEGEEESIQQTKKVKNIEELGGKIKETEKIGELEGGGEKKNDEEEEEDEEEGGEEDIKIVGEGEEKGREGKIEEEEEEDEDEEGSEKKKSKHKILVEKTLENIFNKVSGKPSLPTETKLPELINEDEDSSSNNNDETESLSEEMEELLSKQKRIEVKKKVTEETKNKEEPKEENYDDISSQTDTSDYVKKIFSIPDNTKLIYDKDTAEPVNKFFVSYPIEQIQEDSSSHKLYMKYAQAMDILINFPDSKIRDFLGIDNNSPTRTEIIKQRFEQRSTIYNTIKMLYEIDKSPEGVPIRYYGDLQNLITQESDMTNDCGTLLTSLAVLVEILRNNIVPTPFNDDENDINRKKYEKTKLYIERELIKEDTEREPDDNELNVDDLISKYIYPLVKIRAFLKLESYYDKNGTDFTKKTKNIVAMVKENYDKIKVYENIVIHLSMALQFIKEYLYDYKEHEHDKTITKTIVGVQNIATYFGGNFVRKCALSCLKITQSCMSSLNDYLDLTNFLKSKNRFQYKDKKYAIGEIFNVETDKSFGSVSEFMYKFHLEMINSKIRENGTEIGIRLMMKTAFTSTIANVILNYADDNYAIVTEDNKILYESIKSFARDDTELQLDLFDDSINELDSIVIDNFVDLTENMYDKSDESFKPFLKSGIKMMENNIALFSHLLSDTDAVNKTLDKDIEIAIGEYMTYTYDIDCFFGKFLNIFSTSKIGDVQLNHENISTVKMMSAARYDSTNYIFSCSISRDILSEWILSFDKLKSDPLLPNGIRNLITNHFMKIISFLNEQGDDDESRDKISKFEQNLEILDNMVQQKIGTNKFQKVNIKWNKNPIQSDSQLLSIADTATYNNQRLQLKKYLDSLYKSGTDVDKMIQYAYSLLLEVDYLVFGKNIETLQEMVNSKDPNKSIELSKKRFSEIKLLLDSRKKSDLTMIYREILYENIVTNLTMALQNVYYGSPYSEDEKIIDRDAFERVEKAIQIITNPENDYNTAFSVQYREITNVVNILKSIESKEEIADKTEKIISENVKTLGNLYRLVEQDLTRLAKEISELQLILNDQPETKKDEVNKAKKLIETITEFITSSRKSNKILDDKTKELSTTSQYSLNIYKNINLKQIGLINELREKDKYLALFPSRASEPLKEVQGEEFLETEQENEKDSEITKEFNSDKRILFNIVSGANLDLKKYSNDAINITNQTNKYIEELQKQKSLFDSTFKSITKKIVSPIASSLSKVYNLLSGFTKPGETPSETDIRLSTFKTILESVTPSTSSGTTDEPVKLPEILQNYVDNQLVVEAKDVILAILDEFTKNDDDQSKVIDLFGYILKYLIHGLHQVETFKSNVYDFMRKLEFPNGSLIGSILSWDATGSHITDTDRKKSVLRWKKMFMADKILNLIKDGMESIDGIDKIFKHFFEDSYIDYISIYSPIQPSEEEAKIMNNIKTILKSKESKIVFGTEGSEEEEEEEIIKKNWGRIYGQKIGMLNEYITLDERKTNALNVYLRLFIFSFKDRYIVRLLTTKQNYIDIIRTENLGGMQPDEIYDMVQNDFLRIMEKKEDVVLTNQEKNFRSDVKRDYSESKKSVENIINATIFIRQFSDSLDSKYQSNFSKIESLPLEEDVSGNILSVTKEKPKILTETSFFNITIDEYNEFKKKSKKIAVWSSLFPSMLIENMSLNMLVHEILYGHHRVVINKMKDPKTKNILDKVVKDWYDSKNNYKNLLEKRISNSKLSPEEEASLAKLERLKERSKRITTYYDTKYTEKENVNRLEMYFSDMKATLSKLQKLYESSYNVESELVLLKSSIIEDGYLDKHQYMSNTYYNGKLLYDILSDLGYLNKDAFFDDSFSYSNYQKDRYNVFSFENFMEGTPFNNMVTKIFIELNKDCKLIFEDFNPNPIDVSLKYFSSFITDNSSVNTELIPFNYYLETRRPNVDNKNGIVKYMDSRTIKITEESGSEKILPLMKIEQSSYVTNIPTFTLGENAVKMLESVNRMFWDYLQDLMHKKINSIIQNETVKSSSNCEQIKIIVKDFSQKFDILRASHPGIIKSIRKFVGGAVDIKYDNVDKFDDNFRKDVEDLNKVLDDYIKKSKEMEQKQIYQKKEEEQLKAVDQCLTELYGGYPTDVTYKTIPTSRIMSKARKIIKKTTLEILSLSRDYRNPGLEKLELVGFSGNKKLSTEEMNNQKSKNLMFYDHPNMINQWTEHIKGYPVEIKRFTSIPYLSKKLTSFYEQSLEMIYSFLNDSSWPNNTIQEGEIYVEKIYSKAKMLSELNFSRFKFPDIRKLSNYDSVYADNEEGYVIADNTISIEDIIADEHFTNKKEEEDMLINYKPIRTKISAKKPTTPLKKDTKVKKEPKKRESVLKKTFIIPKNPFPSLLKYGTANDILELPKSLVEFAKTYNPFVGKDKYPKEPSNNTIRSKGHADSGKKMRNSNLRLIQSDLLKIIRFIYGYTLDIMDYYEALSMALKDESKLSEILDRREKPIKELSEYYRKFLNIYVDYEKDIKKGSDMNDEDIIFKYFDNEGTKGSWFSGIDEWKAFKKLFANDLRILYNKNNIDNALKEFGISSETAESNTKESSVDLSLEQTVKQELDNLKKMENEKKFKEYIDRNVKILANGFENENKKTKTDINKWIESTERDEETKKVAKTLRNEFFLKIDDHKEKILEKLKEIVDTINESFYGKSNAELEVFLRTELAEKVGVEINRLYEGLDNFKEFVLEKVEEIKKIPKIPTTIPTPSPVPTSGPIPSSTPTTGSTKIPVPSKGPTPLPVPSTGSTPSPVPTSGPIPSSTPTTGSTKIPAPTSGPKKIPKKTPTGTPTPKLTAPKKVILPTSIKIMDDLISNGGLGKFEIRYPNVAHINALYQEMKDKIGLDKLIMLRDLRKQYSEISHYIKTNANGTTTLNSLRNTFTNAKVNHKDPKDVFVGTINKIISNALVGLITPTSAQTSYFDQKITYLSNNIDNLIRLLNGDISRISGIFESVKRLKLRLQTRMDQRAYDQKLEKSNEEMYNNSFINGINSIGVQISNKILNVLKPDISNTIIPKTYGVLVKWGDYVFFGTGYIRIVADEVILLPNSNMYRKASLFSYFEENVDSDGSSITDLDSPKYGQMLGACLTYFEDVYNIKLSVNYNKSLGMLARRTQYELSRKLFVEYERRKLIKSNADRLSNDNPSDKVLLNNKKQADDEFNRVEGALKNQINSTNQSLNLGVNEIKTTDPNGKYFDMMYLETFVKDRVKSKTNVTKSDLSDKAELTNDEDIKMILISDNDQKIMGDTIFKRFLDNKIVKKSVNKNTEAVEKIINMSTYSKYKTSLKSTRSNQGITLDKEITYHYNLKHSSDEDSFPKNVIVDGYEQNTKRYQVFVNKGKIYYNSNNMLDIVLVPMNIDKNNVSDSEYSETIIPEYKERQDHRTLMKGYPNYRNFYTSKNGHLVAQTFTLDINSALSHSGSGKINMYYSVGE